MIYASIASPKARSKLCLVSSFMNALVNPTCQVSLSCGSL